MKVDTQTPMPTLENDELLLGVTFIFQTIRLCTLLKNLNYCSEMNCQHKNGAPGEEINLSFVVFPDGIIAIMCLD